MTRSQFLPVCPNSFGAELPNLPLTENDPPNSPVSLEEHIESFEKILLLEAQGESISKKRKRREENQETRSCDDDEKVRKSEFDKDWVESKRCKTVRGWIDKGGYRIWRRDEKGRNKIVTKSISVEEAMSRDGRTAIRIPQGREKGKGKRGMDESSWPSSESKRHYCESEWQGRSSKEEDLDENIQRSILSSVLHDQPGEVIEPDQSPKEV